MRVITTMEMEREAVLVRRYFPAFWTWLCDTAIEDGFTIEFCTQAPSLSKLTELYKRKVIRALLESVVMEYANDPVNCPVLRDGHIWEWNPRKHSL